MKKLPLISLPLHWESDYKFFRPGYVEGQGYIILDRPRTEYVTIRIIFRDAQKTDVNPFGIRPVEFRIKARITQRAGAEDYMTISKRQYKTLSLKLGYQPTVE